MFDTVAGPESVLGNAAWIAQVLAAIAPGVTAASLLTPGGSGFNSDGSLTIKSAGGSLGGNISYDGDLGINITDYIGNGIQVDSDNQGLTLLGGIGIYDQSLSQWVYTAGTLFGAFNGDGSGLTGYAPSLGVGTSDASSTSDVALALSGGTSGFGWDGTYWNAQSDPITAGSFVGDISLTSNTNPDIDAAIAAVSFNTSGDYPGATVGYAVNANVLSGGTSGAGLYWDGTYWNAGDGADPINAGTYYGNGSGLGGYAPSFSVGSADFASTAAGALNSVNGSLTGFFGYGPIDATGLPTSDPGVSGQLWNNSGVLSISP